MLIIIHTKDVKESFEIEASNLPQVVDYLKNNKPELWKSLKDIALVYSLGDSTNILRPIPIYPEGVNVNFSTYNTLLIGEKVKLSAPAAAAAVAAYASSAAFVTAGGVAAGAAAATAATIASVAAYALTYVAVSLAVSLAIGAVIQALSPTTSVSGDPSTSQSNRIFNGVPNIKEQGGSVPIVLGKCIFGGVVIAADMYSVSTGLVGTSVAVGGSGETPLVNVPANSNWYRVG